ncbi:MAG TPA: hypothetical protein VK524_08050 [Polyangiaceae bacterium]|nr:hypothetical protein [Polyangiaceae bacterium]
MSMRATLCRGKILFALTFVPLAACGDDDGRTDDTAVDRSDAAVGDSGIRDASVAKDATVQLDAGEDAGDAGTDAGDAVARCPEPASLANPVPGCPCGRSAGAYCCLGMTIACTSAGVWGPFTPDDGSLCTFDEDSGVTPPFLECI